MLLMMAATTKGKATARPGGSGTMTFDEAMERYDGEWLVLRIVSEDKLRRPDTVQVAARAADRTAAYAALDLLRSEEPKATFWVWEAAWCIRTGEQMRRTLAQVSEFYEGDPFVWPRW
jgi:hypothetical protein